MTGLKLEGFLQLKELDPATSNANKGFFRTIWERCRAHVSNDSQQLHQLDQWLETYNSKAFEIRQSYSELLCKFTEFFRDVPFITALGRWLQSMMVDEFWRHKYLDGMMHLLEKGLIPLKDSDGKCLTLESFKLYGHQNIIENIRCIKEWSIWEKEAIVQSYIQFSQSLARDTFNFIPHGFDPDRQKVANKIVHYEAFLDFVQHLSRRDALIAQLIYFGAPAIADVLSLLKKQVDFNTLKILYEDTSVLYPKHIIIALQESLQEVDQEALVFTNANQSRVERAHLNHTFTRIFSKRSCRQHFSPGDLLRYRES